ncbi:hypothetical protein NU219Hw_g7041t2 [Hortaea werneckii]
MASHLLTFLLIGTLLVSATQQQTPKRALHVEAPVKKLTVRSSPLQSRQDCKIFDFCNGSCESCFGTGFTLCPGDTFSCYKPGDVCYPIETCSDGSSSDADASVSYSFTSSSSVPVSSSYATSSVPYQYTSSATYSAASGSTSTDYCSGSCVTCWGAGYTECPSSARYCYNPDVYDSVCPGDDGGSEDDYYDSSATVTSSIIASSDYGFDSTSTLYGTDYSISSISFPVSSQSMSTSSSVAVATSYTTASMSDLTGATAASTSSPATYLGGAASQPLASSLPAWAILATLGFVLGGAYLLAI